MTDNKIWWKKLREFELEKVITNYNVARYRDLPIEQAKYYFDSINQLWKRFDTHRKVHNLLTEIEQKEGRKDSTSLRQLLLKGLTDEAKEELCHSSVMIALVKLDPRVMNHDTLRELNYDPEDISEEQRLEAEKEHYELITQFQTKSKNTSDLIKKLCRLIYVIRSNIAHGEKTPQGPDLNKVKRDDNVCNTAIPVLEMIIDLLLDRPSEKLSVYGTLAADGANSHLLDNMNGEWINGRVKGEITFKNNLPYFKWDVVNQKQVDVKVFKSKSLPQKLHELDNFEGETYKRILVPIKVGNDIEITNIYEKADNIEIE